MASRNFYIQLIVRVVFLALTAIAMAFSLAYQWYFTMGLCALALIIQVFSLITFINSTNRKIAYFFDAIKNEDFTIDVGKGQMDPEFEGKLVGMNTGEEASHEVQFPEKHPNPILAAKNIEFRIKVKDVKERVLAELDDEFAKDVNESFKTLDDLKTMIRERLEADKLSAAGGELNDRIMQKLLENHSFDVPERLVRFEVEQMIKQTEEQLQKSGMSLEAAGLNREELAKNNEPVAVQRVRGDFILKKIAEVEEIKVNDEDLERTFTRIGEQYNMPADRVKEFFKSRDDLLPLMNEVLNEKILNFLKDNAKFVEPAAKEETPAEPDEEQGSDAADE